MKDNDKFIKEKALKSRLYAYIVARGLFNDYIHFCQTQYNSPDIIKNNF